MIHQDYIQAGATAATRGILRRLSSSEIPAVRRRVAENSKTPILILAILAKDPESEVRIAVGLNKATPAKIIKQLLHDDNADVRYALAETSYLHQSFLQLLATDDNCFVSQRAMRTISALYSSVIYLAIKMYIYNALPRHW